MVDTNPPGQTARRERTRSRLMDAAFEVFAEVGFNAASLELICERAGLTRGAFYYNFASKEELFLAIMVREFETTMELLPEVGVPAQGEQELNELVDLIGLMYLSRIHDHITSARMTEEFRLHALRDPVAAKAYSEQFGMIHLRLGELLRQAASAHHLRLLAPPETIAAIVTGVFIQAVTDGILAGSDDQALQQTISDRLAVTVGALMPPDDMHNGADAARFDAYARVTGTARTPSA